MLELKSLSFFYKRENVECNKGIFPFVMKDSIITYVGKKVNK